MEEMQPKEYRILESRFSLLSYEDVLKTVVQWRQRQERHYVTLTPPYSVLMCRHDPDLREATNGAELTLPDGVGIILAARLLRYPHHGRVTGPTLMLRVCDWGRQEGLRHFFYGGMPGVADSLAKRLIDQYPGLHVTGTCCPPFRELSPAEDTATVEQINAARPDIVWIGLGSPKQEKWMARHVGRIGAAALIGVGAAFDFHSGRVKWAPPWMRNLGIEWAYRLIVEPRRMWYRNLNSLVFLAGILRQRSFGTR
jgi:N-acetylglucosaminyldiphosphoundecaprenol N-acetyl-beta-D-mannosaminyltransferase